MSELVSTQDYIKTEVIVYAIKKLSTYDFSNYAVPVLARRLKKFAQENDYADLTVLLSDLLDQNEQLIESVVQQLTITHSHFFRDSEYFKRLYYTVINELDAFPKIKVWSLACAGGEEVYSLAIMFALKGMLERVSILGTDINEKALNQAKEGHYELDRTAELQAQFKSLELQQHSIVDYIDTDKTHFYFKPEVQKVLNFEFHNIINGGSFGEMHLLCCRNVLIYLSLSEQQRVVEELLIPSLAPRGFLMLGDAENIEVFKQYPQLKKLAPGINLFQKQ